MALVCLPGALWSGALVVLGLSAATPDRPEWLARLLSLSDRRWAALGIALILVGLFCFVTTVSDRWFSRVRQTTMVWTAEMVLLSGGILGLLAAFAR